MTENETLGLLIKYADEDDYVDISELMSKESIHSLKLSEMLTPLEQKGYVTYYDTCTYSLNSSGRAAYVSLEEKKKRTAKNIVSFILDKILPLFKGFILAFAILYFIG